MVGPKSKFSILGAILAFAFLTGCGPVSRPNPTQDETRDETPGKAPERPEVNSNKFATPHEAFEAAKKANQRGDKVELFKCFVEEDFRIMVGTMIRISVSFHRATIQLKKDDNFAHIAEILDDHGLKDLYSMPATEWRKLVPRGVEAKEDDQRLLELGQRLKRPYKYIQDNERVVSLASPPPLLADFGSGVLKDMVVRDDVATGVVHSANAGDNYPIEFKKSNGGWRIRLKAGKDYKAIQLPPEPG